MKVAVTGSSGFIGQDILSQCLANPMITSVIAVSRRQLLVSSPKLRTVIHDDFSSYPSSLMSELQDADACIYALGTVSPSKPEFNRRVNMDYTISAAKAFAKSAALHTSGRQGKKFRFVYCSGTFTERDQGKHLWIMSQNRKMRGEVELQLLDLSREAAGDGLEIFIARPGFVQARYAKLRTLVVGSLFKAIRVDVFAVAMIKIAVSGAENQIVENDVLVMLEEGSARLL